MIFTPHPYQERAIAHILNHPSCALWLDMGLGKTVIVLSAIKELLDCLEISRVLVIAPKAVAVNTWPSEVTKWEHLQGLTMAVAVGTEQERIAAIESNADITVINRDAVEWLEAHYRGRNWQWDMVVADESSSFKNPSSKRFKALRRARPYIRRMVELTGTPSPNGLEDLWAQAWLLDQGKRLCPTVTAYRRKWFRPGWSHGNIVYKWQAIKGAAEEISGALSDICLSMRAEDYLTLPDMMEMDTPVTLDAKVMEGYRVLERDCLLRIQGETIVASQAAALVTKLLEYTGGGLYNDKLEYVHVHKAKIDALRAIVESSDCPVLCYYGYTGELGSIMAELGDLSPVLFAGEPEILSQWDKREIRLLLCHPASVAYGLNMQDGGHVIVWYTQTWNLELYQQANARLHRQGQGAPVMVYRLAVPGSIDQRVIGALEGKGNLQELVMSMASDVL